MKQYSNGRKGAIILLHAMFTILMISSVFGMQYQIHDHFRDGVILYSVLTVIGVVGSFVALAYLTNITGRVKPDDETVKCYAIDKIPFDLFVILACLVGLLFAAVIKTSRKLEFDIAGSMITSGTVAFLLDMVFLVFYMSMIRRIRANQLFQNSLIARLLRLFRAKKETKRPLFLCTQKSRESYRIQEAIEAISKGALDTKLDEESFHGQQRDIAVAVNHIREGLQQAVNDNTKNERMKADLITNVSHDIKTPLTSIVNYVDLLKRVEITDENARNYIRIIDEKANRLKVLTEDLVEASKISSGNIKLDMQRIDFVELIYQTGGEFNERFEAKDLTIVTKIPNESIFIEADGRQLYRVVENLYTNAAKYSLEKTRVYVEMFKNSDRVTFVMKNIAKNPENLSRYTDLTDRFVRGEESRTTEGSGLGLSIAKNLTLLMGGEFAIKVEDDLFVATISFKIACH